MAKDCWADADEREAMIAECDRLRSELEQAREERNIALAGKVADYCGKLAEADALRAQLAQAKGALLKLKGFLCEEALRNGRDARAHADAGDATLARYYAGRRDFLECDALREYLDAALASLAQDAGVKK